MSTLKGGRKLSGGHMPAPPRKTLGKVPVTFLLEGDSVNHFTTALPSNTQRAATVSICADPSSSDECRTAA